MIDPIVDLSNDNFSKTKVNDKDNENNMSASGSESEHSISGELHAEKRSENLVPEIAGRENRLVLYSKLLVFAVLACSAAAVGILTFYFVTSEEENDYTAQVSNKLEQKIGHSYLHLCDRLHLFSTSSILY
jgi:hypothetical protein